MSSQKNRKKAAFTLVEILMALAITAALMAAVAVAFNASVINYGENEDIFKAVNSARQAVSRITTQLRTAQAVDPNAPSNECTMITAAGENITYRYDSTDDTLYLVTNDDTTDSDYVLCKDVGAATFTKYTFLDVATIKVKSVQIGLTVSSGGIEQKVSAASVIRRNLQ
jgi:prepilin-type N-terminal cleavage/methylation domain-containing protein